MLGLARRALHLLRPPAAFRRSDRRIVTLMTVAGVAQGFTGGLLTATLPFARRGLEASQGDMSLVLAVTRVGALAALAFSMYGDHRGRRRPFLVAFVLLSLGSGATALVPGILTFALAQSLVRAATVALSALAAVFLAEVLTPSIRAYGIAFYAIAGSIGGGTALLLLPIAEGDPGGWRILFGLGALGLVAFPLLVRTLAESPIFRLPSARAPLSAVIRRPHTLVFWRLALVSFLVGAYSAPAITFTMERLITHLRWDASTARFLVIGAGATGSVGLLVGGRLADLWGRRPTIVLSLATGLGGGLGFYWLDSGWLLAPAIALASFGSSAFIPAFTAHRSELFPTSIRATAAAWLSNAGILGSLTSFGLGFLFLDRLGLPIGVSFLGIGVVVAALVVLGLPETRGVELIPD
ncbi:MAG: MFS transporter [Actinomycetota bacterium]|nr:MFS transporter [Actinomycetota bacterium]